MRKTKKCYLCESNLDKDAIGLNKKLVDKSINQFLCIACLASHLDISEEDLREKIEEFKKQGCVLFE
jgi:biotin operon repressor